MKAILVIFDSLSRKYLPSYGCDWVKADNFNRLSEKSVTFDKCFVGSMPCMPARRELHTGRYNFLHRSWGPIEPFDDSMPQILKENGVFSHLISDHYHYWQDGGATYHNRYSSWENVRGQEGDAWKCEVKDPEAPEAAGLSMRQDWINRKYMTPESNMSQTKTFDLAMDFLQTNSDQGNWFLQVECFDPHPPFFAAERFREKYRKNYHGPHFDWPDYCKIKDSETPEMIEHCQREYASLVSQCDYSLGRIMDFMDQNDMWNDTMLIVTTDHGFQLGEHDAWCFCHNPFYNEVCIKPLFVWDPRCGRKNERCNELVQTHDLPATILEYFNIDRPENMQGKVLRDTVADNKPVREACLFGTFGGHVNCSDGRYVYMKAPCSQDNKPLYNYTLMPTHLAKFFRQEELEQAELVPPFNFTKNMPLLKTPGIPQPLDFNPYDEGDLLFDMGSDPQQLLPITDRPDLTAKMAETMVALMKENDAPPEQFERLGLID
ncbi:MAG: sulfatase [Victivallaceae bacterium]|nr:sulfatase [Victivallaceae bacterium]MDD3703459.1 sulfatase [Victivallaceae bacterium]